MLLVDGKNGWQAKNKSRKIKILNPKNEGLEDDVPFQLG